MAGIEEARAAKAKAAGLLRGHRALRGIGIVRMGDSFAIKVNLADPDPALSLPAELDGVPVHVAVVGEIRARGA